MNSHPDALHSAVVARLAPVPQPGPAYGTEREKLNQNPLVVRRPGVTANRAAQAGSPLPLVSVITVVLNRRHTLLDAMQSVFAQTYTGPIEYVLIDGGSTDGTVDLIQAHQDRIAIFLSERDAGISDAFNRGLALASGAIIGILNSDDWYAPDTIERVVAAFQQTPGTGVACGRLQYWKGETPDAIFPSHPDRLGIDMTVNHPTMFVHRAVYEHGGLFKLNYRYAMDYELALRFQAMRVQFASIDAVLANMRFDGAADRNWYSSLREMRQAQREIYPGNIKLARQYLFKFVRACVGRLFATLGLDAINRFYRSHISSFRRQYGETN